MYFSTISQDEEGFLWKRLSYGNRTFVWMTAKVYFKEILTEIYLENIFKEIFGIINFEIMNYCGFDVWICHFNGNI